MSINTQNYQVKFNSGSWVGSRIATLTIDHQKSIWLENYGHQIKVHLLCKRGLLTIVDLNHAFTEHWWMARIIRSRENFVLRPISGVGACIWIRYSLKIFLGLNSPASSPSVRDFSCVSMKSSLHIWPIVVNLRILFSTWIVPRNLSKKLKYTKKKKEEKKGDTVLFH